MCTPIAGIVTSSVGVVLVIVVTVVHFNIIPTVINNVVLDSVVLKSDTIQWERFLEPPFPLQFSVRFFNITNPQVVLNGGVPNVEEVGPFVYRMYTKRLVESVSDDTVAYRRQEIYEFNAEATYPLTEQDEVTIVNVAYHAILQSAETAVPNLMFSLNYLLSDIFGSDKNSPIATFKVADLLLQGVKLCHQPGAFGGIACGQIKALGAHSRNLEVQNDGSLLFSFIRYKNGSPSDMYEASLGAVEAAHLGAISGFAGEPVLYYWPEAAGGAVPDAAGSGVCNMINGTDAFIYRPFVDREEKIYALNTDICRSVELRYARDSSYNGIPSVVYTADDWFLDNNEGCFCVNQTKGIRGEDGCLLPGALELISCVGGPLVLTYPHFLFAAQEYRNGVIGLTPNEDKHKITLHLEPYTGTPLQGYKRAQFNLFLRPISGITATNKLRTTLTPIFWIEEGVELPDEFVDEIQSRLISNLQLIDILVPMLFTIAAVILAAGLAITGSAYYKRGRISQPNQTITDAAKDPVPTTSTIEYAV